MNIKKLASGVSLALAMSFAAGTAHASLYSFEDDDIDFVLDSTGAVKTSGALVVGDTFLSVFEIPVFTIDGANAIPAGMELTGLSAVTLLSINGGAGPSATGIGDQYVFGAATVPGVHPIFSGDSAIAMWLNSTADFDLDLNRSTNAATNCTGLADCVAKASAGELFQNDGFLEDPDEFWVATQTVATQGGDVISTIKNANNGAIVTTVNFALSNIFNKNGPIGFINASTGLQCADGGAGCVQFAGSATITGGQGLSNGAIAHSDFDAAKYTAVPEPNAMALLGMGLLGFGARFAKRKA